MDIGKGDWVVCTKGYSPYIETGVSYYVQALLERTGTCSGCRATVGSPVLNLMGVATMVCPCILRPLRKPPGEEVARTTRVCEPA